jgi:N utilization substance protein B
LSRKKAREKAVQLLYQLEIQKDEIEEQIDTFISDNNEIDNSYIRNSVNGVLENKSEIDSIIQGYSKDWAISRIAKVDLSILRLAIYELTKSTDIPQNVAINEAVELAKKFSTNEASAFINGILAEVVRNNIPKGE